MKEITKIVNGLLELCEVFADSGAMLPDEEKQLNELTNQWYRWVKVNKEKLK